MNHQVLAFLFVLITFLLTADFARGRGVSETGGATREQKQEDVALMERLINDFVDTLNLNASTDRDAASGLNHKEHHEPREVPAILDFCAPNKETNHKQRLSKMTGSERVPTAKEIKDALMSKVAHIECKPIPYPLQPGPKNDLVRYLLKFFSCFAWCEEFKHQIICDLSDWEYMCIAY